MDNMNESELYGRTIRVNIAKPMKNKEGYSRAVWNSDEWLQEHAVGAEKNGATENGDEKEKGETTDEVNSHIILVNFKLGIFVNVRFLRVQTSGEPAAKKRRKNPKCYIDISMNDQYTGRIVVELRADVVPMTAGMWV